LKPYREGSIVFVLYVSKAYNYLNTNLTMESTQHQKRKYVKQKELIVGVRVRHKECITKT